MSDNEKLFAAAVTVLVLVLAWAWWNCKLAGYVKSPSHCGAADPFVTSFAPSADFWAGAFPYYTCNGVECNDYGCKMAPRPCAATPFQFVRPIWV
jgi:hypothetical protein